MEALLVLNDGLIRAHYCVSATRPIRLPHYLKVHIQVNRLNSSQLSFPLSCFVIEGFCLRALGQFAYILCSDQCLAPVVWLPSKAHRML